MKLIISDVCLAIYQYLGFGVVFGLLFMIALPSLEEKGPLNLLKDLFVKARHNKNVLSQFLFAVYLFMILSKTLICRDLWAVPWSNVIGEWWLYTKTGELNVEGMENLALFIPLVTLYYRAFSEKYQGYKFNKLVGHSVKVTFLFSLGIECCQLFGRLGTFQLSDIVQNTVGGLTGGCIYWLIRKCLNVRCRD